jgi:general secretion pathway protein C
MFMDFNVATWLSPSVQRRAAWLLTVGLALICAWLLVRIVWSWLTPFPDTDSTVQNAMTVSAGSPSAIQARPPLSRWHLFGEFEENRTLAAYRDAPETALELELRGILSSDNPQSGFAIIIYRSRQAVYGIGQDLPGDARVEAIYPDRVVLLRAGRYETLRLPLESQLPQPEHSTPGQGGQVDQALSSARPPMSVMVPGASGKLSLSMNSAAANYGLIPVSSGGYRLFLGRNAGVVASLGLQNGDIILSGNGISLNSQQDVEQVIANILAGERLNLLINRGGQELSLSPDISAILSEVR